MIKLTHIKYDYLDFNILCSYNYYIDIQDRRQGVCYYDNIIYKGTYFCKNDRADGEELSYKPNLKL